MMGVLNPQIAKEKAQEKEIASLKEEVGGIKGTLSSIESMLQKALAKKSNGSN